RSHLLVKFTHLLLMDSFSTTDFDLGGGACWGDAEEETPAERTKRLRMTAKHRRDTETSILNELTELIPLDKDVVGKQDKSSQLRLVLTYMRCRNAIEAGSDDFDENSREDVTWSNEPDLLPVSCSLGTALPLKDDQRQTDIELDDGYGSSPFNDTAGEQSPPHGCRKR
ncbi:unnamed protein product, partial [Lymnaea stagnalis]